MKIDVNRLGRELGDMPLPRLQGKYAEVFGEATRSNHREYLIKRVLWRVQANAQGDLSERARRRAMELASDADLRRTPPRAPAAHEHGPVVVAAFRPRPPGLPAPGTMLTREYKGKRVTVTVLDRGFEYGGESYRSLSAIANKVTGGHWSGRAFFNLENPR